ncbi:gluconolactonase [Rhodococcus rhodochrous J45]|uniref:Gluconolactonase n=1 Tax=Rhodococcus rhodochrous J45 TaxID=935266 RepID=A0A562D8C3_RHORH|nr:isochorismatase family protein [Rhodococcus rhodochrous]TWH06019.1 gluconolactonase [Rhodococcus rhodochrous J45]
MTSLSLDLDRTALVLIDLQNDNVHPDGAYAAFGAAAHAAEQHLLEHVRELLDWARTQTVPVIHNHIVSFPGRPFGGQERVESRIVV